MTGYETPERDPQAEGWCWSAKHWRWEHRERRWGPALGFVHVEKIIAVPWADLQADLAARGLPPLPEAARDVPAWLLDRLK